MDKESQQQPPQRQTQPQSTSSNTSSAVNDFADKFRTIGVSAEEKTTTDLTNAVNLADKIRIKVSNYAHPVRTEPPLPHGFVEGGLVGLVTYGVTRPIRTQAMKFVGRSSPQGSRIKPLVGMVITVGQVLASAQTALYSAVLVGSHAWLSTLTDFAAAPCSSSGTNATKTNLHKSILADDLCREPIMLELLARPPPSADMGELPSTGTTSSSSDAKSVSFMDWAQNPKRAVTDELFRAVASCRNRQTSTTTKTEDDRKR